MWATGIDSDVLIHRGASCGAMRFARCVSSVSCVSLYSFFCAHSLTNRKSQIANLQVCESTVYHREFSSPDHSLPVAFYRRDAGAQRKLHGTGRASKKAKDKDEQFCPHLRLPDKTRETLLVTGDSAWSRTRIFTLKPAFLVAHPQTCSCHSNNILKTRRSYEKLRCSSDNTESIGDGGFGRSDAGYGLRHGRNLQ